MEGISPSGVGAGDKEETPSAGVLLVCSSSCDSGGEVGGGGGGVARFLPFLSPRRLTCRSMELRITGSTKFSTRAAWTFSAFAKRSGSASVFV